MRPSLIIFDLDGTLLDSFRDIAEAVNGTLQAMSLPALSLAQIKQHIGQGARYLLEQCLIETGATSEHAMAEARKHFYPLYRDNLAVYTTLYPGVRETLNSLANQDITLTVCTNKPIELAEPLLQQLQLRSFFVDVLGGNSLPKRKPDPAPLLHLIQQTQATPRDTLMVGDSQYDIIAGKRAGTRTCGVTYGHHDRAEMEELQPDLTLDTLPPLIQWFESTTPNAG
jgi:phosphoglycolate phosphatase